MSTDVDDLVLELEDLYRAGRLGDWETEFAMNVFDIWAEGRPLSDGQLSKAREIVEENR